MAGKKKTTRKKGEGFFSFFKKKPKSRSTKKTQTPMAAGLKITAGIMIATILIASAAIGMIYMERHVLSTAGIEHPDGSLKLINPPDWLDQQWVDTLVRTAGDKRFKLDKVSAGVVAQRLESLSWMENVRVQTTAGYISVSADYRKPVGLVNLSGGRRYYLDIDNVVLDYIPVTKIPVVEITGLAAVRSIPDPGHVWIAEDAAAAVDLLNRLYQYDQHFLNKQLITRPLLDDIQSIDVANFAERKNRSKPQIVLHVTDGTEVHWGAAWGQSTLSMEAYEEEKIQKLYKEFIDNKNSLCGYARHFDLLTPKDQIPRPR